MYTTRLQFSLSEHSIAEQYVILEMYERESFIVIIIIMTHELMIFIRKGDWWFVKNRPLCRHSFGPFGKEHSWLSVWKTSKNIEWLKDPNKIFQ